MLLQVIINYYCLTVKVNISTDDNEWRQNSASSPIPAREWVRVVQRVRRRVVVSGVRGQGRRRAARGVRGVRAGPRAPAPRGGRARGALRPHAGHVLVWTDKQKVIMIQTQRRPQLSLVIEKKINLNQNQIKISIMYKVLTEDILIVVVIKL